MYMNIHISRKRFLVRLASFTERGTHRSAQNHSIAAHRSQNCSQNTETQHYCSQNTETQHFCSQNTEFLLCRTQKYRFAALRTQNCCSQHCSQPSQVLLFHRTALAHGASAQQRCAPHSMHCYKTVFPLPSCHSQLPSCRMAR